MDQEKELARLRPQLVRFAMLRLRNREQAEDAVQETLLAALEGLDRYAGTASLASWLHGILGHKIVDSLRSAARYASHPPEGVPFPGSDPQEGLERRRFLETVQRGLTRLPPGAARVFVLREVLGMETSEICGELAISAGNCWVTLHRARRRLRACAEIRELAANAI